MITKWSHGKCLLLDVLNSPDIIRKFTVHEWQTFVRQARGERLLAKCYLIFEQKGALNDMPVAVKQHLYSAFVVAQRHAKSVRWEVDRILVALKELDVDVVFLKGTAYLLAGYSCSFGRLYNDVDVLFDETIISEVERTLLINGWAHENLDEYDNQYYRNWTHEIPPLRHRRRGTILDVHHAISPDIFRHPIRYAELIDVTTMLQDRVRILAKEDMLLHAIVHLINEEDFTTSFRDIVDIRDLIEEFSDNEAFWQKLLMRAKQFNYEIPLYYALVLVKRLFVTSIPQNIVDELSGNLSYRKKVIANLLIAMLSSVMLPKDKECSGLRLTISEWLLYVRGHYLRMPLYLLLPHLLRKSFKQK